MREPDATPRLPTAARVVVLTSGGPYGVDVARRLAERDVPCAVVVESRAAVRHCFRAAGWRRAVELPLALGRAVVRWRRLRARREALSRWSSEVHVSGALGSRRFVDDIARLRPDLLVLAGIGLVEQRILALPRLGTVNGHPALLPWARGNGVVAHSLARGVAVGATVHRVDAGIDTGDVLSRRLLPVAPGASLTLLSAEAVALAAELLAHVVAGAVRAGALPPGVPQSSRFALCRWMEASEWRGVAAAVADGLAERLFARWATTCEPAGPPWTLPPGADAPADVSKY